MPLVSVPYQFSVVLPAPPRAAFRWATDYAPDDWARMGQEGIRRIATLTPDAIVLTDTVLRGRSWVTKTRLVRLYPGRLAWTNTHVGGPARHSQFLYELEPAGRGRSRLTFTGRQIERSARPLGPSALAARSRELAREDRALWLHLATVMRRELASEPSSGRRPVPRRRRARGSR